MEFVVSETLIEACARVAHEANRAYCVALGDSSQTDWESAPDWQKSSARSGVRHALAGATAEQMHNSWLAEKLRLGWSYGEVKDAGRKVHPCMVPYFTLPPEQRAKDALHLAVVRSVAAALNGCDLGDEAAAPCPLPDRCAPPDLGRLSSVHIASFGEPVAEGRRYRFEAREPVGSMLVRCLYVPSEYDVEGVTVTSLRVDGAEREATDLEVRNIFDPLCFEGPGIPMRQVLEVTLAGPGGDSWPRWPAIVCLYCEGDHRRPDVL